MTHLILLAPPAHKQQTLPFCPSFCFTVLLTADVLGTNYLLKLLGKDVSPDVSYLAKEKRKLLCNFSFMPLNREFVRTSISLLLFEYTLTFQKRTQVGKSLNPLKCLLLLSKNHSQEVSEIKQDTDKNWIVSDRW